MGGSDAELDKLLGTGDSGVEESEGGGTSEHEEYVEPEGGQHSEPEGDGQPEVGEPDPQAAEHTTTWADTPLPEDHPYYGKYRSLGDLTKANRSSREEALRLHKENEELRRYVMERQQQQQSPRAEPKDDDFFGYASMDAYQKSLQIDPRGTLDKVFDRVIASKQDTFEKIVEDRVNAAIQPFRMQQRQEAMKQQWEALAQREPTLRKDSPAQQACVDYMANNKAEVRALLENPNISNPVEIIFRNATHGLLRAQLENQSKRVEGKRRMAATARPGTGRGATPKDDGSPRSLVEAAVADAAADGVTVSKSAQEQMERELRRANLNY